MSELNACTLCALCNGGSAAYLLSRDERLSPRHAVWCALRQKESSGFYAFMLNGHAEARCPLAIPIDAAVIAARGRLVKRGDETPANAAMVARLRAGKSPFR